MFISRRTQRRMRNTEGIFSFDTEKKVATVPLHYDTPDDLLDIPVSSPDAPAISDDALDYIRNVISDVPEEFHVDIPITVDDYGGYTPSRMMDSMRAAIENTFYYHDEKRRENNVLAAFFIIVGLLALSIEIIGGSSGWFGADGSASKVILETITDVLTWVFLWEGAAILLLTYENESTAFSREMHRIHRMSFETADGTQCAFLDKNTFYKGWIYLSPKEAFARGYILFTNALILAAAVLQVVRCIALRDSLSAGEIVLHAANCVLAILLVIANVSLYLDMGHLRKYAFPLSAAVLLFNVVCAVLYLVKILNSPVFFVFNCIFALALMLSMLCIKYMARQIVEV